jgi:hypothetical protein
MTLGSTQPLVEMSTRNIPGGKGGGCVGLTTSPPSRAECHEIWESKPPGTLWATPGLLRDSFTFTLTLEQKTCIAHKVRVYLNLSSRIDHSIYSKHGSIIRYSDIQHVVNLLHVCILLCPIVVHLQEYILWRVSNLCTQHLVETFIILINTKGVMWKSRSKREQKHV